MADAMKVVSTPGPVRTGVRDVEPIARALSNVLADTYRLLFKSHACHWNVEGPLFHAVHTLTEEHYLDMFDAADELAERIRALGQLAPARLEEIMSLSVVKDADQPASAMAMVEDLAADHERVAHRLHALIELAEARRDAVTADLATARSAFHEKAAWMLRATAK